MAVAGDDFTVRGGAADAAIHEKQVQAEQMAHELRLPLVRLIDGTGGGGSVKTLETSGVTYVPACPGWNWVVANLGTIPVVALGMGPVAGLGAARLVSSHYSVLVKGIGQMFAAGPSLVAAAGRSVTKDELGGALIHARSPAPSMISLRTSRARWGSRAVSCPICPPRSTRSRSGAPTPIRRIDASAGSMAPCREIAERPTR